MREKIVKILFTPIPGTQSIEQGLFRVMGISSAKLRQWSVPSLIFLLKSLRWFVPSVIGLLAIWMIGGNFLASQQEKEIEQDIEEFVKRFPDTEPNDSALKLRKLMAKLGISGGGTPEFPIDAYTLSHPDFAVSPSDGQAFEEIRGELQDYLDAQLSKPNDTIDTIPKKLRTYLKKNVKNIEDISKHILQNGTLQWQRDMTPILEGELEFDYPGYLNLVYLQYVISLGILEKNSLDQIQGAEEMLDISWKINQSLSNEYYLNNQLFSLMAGRYITGVIRKLEYLPFKWQERLFEHNYQKSLSTSLEVELFLGFNIMQDLHLYSSENMWGKTNLLLRVLHLPISKPYARFSFINIYNHSRQLTAEYNQHNICLSDPEKIDENPTWWNIPAQQIFPIYIDKPSAASQYMLDLELTQKILHVKELASKTGKWPQSVPNMKSEICPGVEWVYQVSPDGTMSISLSEQPEWLTERIENQNALPLTYSTQRIPNYDESQN
jgi:hypothetical protein